MSQQKCLPRFAAILFDFESLRVLLVLVNRHSYVGIFSANISVTGIRRELPGSLYTEQCSLDPKVFPPDLRLCRPKFLHRRKRLQDQSDFGGAFECQHFDPGRTLLRLKLKFIKCSPFSRNRFKFLTAAPFSFRSPCYST